MKKIKVIHGIMYMLTFLLIILLGIGIYVSRNLMRLPGAEGSNKKQEEYAYHVMAIVDGSNEAYGLDFKNGLMEIAGEKKVALEFIQLDERHYKEQLLDQLDLAKYAKVDGIIVQAILDQDLIAKIKNLITEGIPVITLGEDLPSSMRTTYVGTNRYEIGQYVGELFLQAIKEEGHIAIIEQEPYAKDLTNTTKEEDRILIGLKDKMRTSEVELPTAVYYTEQGVLGAESVASKILDQLPDVKGIFCTDGQNTLGVVQYLLDNNKIHNIQVVGFGDNKDIRDYISDSQLIKGSLFIDNKEVGKQAMKAFIQYKESLFVPSYQDVPLQILTLDNMEKTGEKQVR